MQMCESKEIVAYEILYEELSRCHLNQIKLRGLDQIALVITEHTRKQMDLPERINMAHLVLDSKVKELRMQDTKM